MKKDNEPSLIQLSVCIITYNHSRFIDKAIQSVLNQNTTFDFEIIIADDCSSDNTRDIILSYKEQFPDKFKLIFQESNVGPKRNFYDLLTGSDKKYISYLEGDDFWIDDNKLQKQFDYLENNKDCSAVVGNAEKLSEEGELLNIEVSCVKSKFDQKDFFSGGGYFITSTIMFLREAIEDYSKLMQDINGGDRLLTILLTEKNNKIGCLNEKICAYRLHGGGVYSMKSEFVKYKKIYDDFLHYKNSSYYSLYKSEINKKLSSSLYVMGRYYFEQKMWKEYFHALFSVIKLTSKSSKVFNFKMFVTNFILPKVKS